MMIFGNILVVELNKELLLKEKIPRNALLILSALGLENHPVSGVQDKQREKQQIKRTNNPGGEEEGGLPAGITERNTQPVSDVFLTNPCACKLLHCILAESNLNNEELTGERSCKNSLSTPEI